MSSPTTTGKKMSPLRKLSSMSSLGRLKRSGSSGSGGSRRRLGDRSSSGGNGHGSGSGSGAMYVPGRKQGEFVASEEESESEETTRGVPSPSTSLSTSPRTEGATVREADEKAGDAAAIEDELTAGTDATADEDDAATMAVTEKKDDAAAMDDELTAGTDATADEDAATMATAEPLEDVTTTGPTMATPSEEGTSKSDRRLSGGDGADENSEHAAASSSEAAPEYDYVFGFGSIMNTATHAPWLEGGGDGIDGGGGDGIDGIDGGDGDHQSSGPSQSRVLSGAVARIGPGFGYRRGWNFRSSTGFTALGVSRCGAAADDGDVAPPATAINGVLFRVHRSMMGGFDRREVGYDRVEIDREHIEMIPSGEEGAVVRNDVFDSISPHGKIWMYVPQASCCSEADENHPLLQSYVDTVMQGCLEWGGEPMAREFVATTDGWSGYFLNDTPSSRRPWLFRRQYETIDRILGEDSSRTRYADRRHPEEFASAFLLRMMRGTWSVPRRNANFTGRDAELSRIRARLMDGDDGAPSSHHGGAAATTGVSRLEVAGMGGVGKTQICTEYCYRYFPSHYGLVVWLNAAGGAETLSADYRQLMADLTGADVKDKDTDEVVAEVKARLFRSKVPWLLVFDNLEDRSALDRFVPHGAGSGHVLVTTRLVELGDQARTLQLGCFDPPESVELLGRSAGQRNTCGEKNVSAAHRLADRLGHLPLALGMAAAYMNRCDVDCDEYLTRYDASAGAGGGGGSLLSHQAGAVVGYQLGVAASLSLSLDAIFKENRTAWEALRLLCWLGPDHITKALLRSLIGARNASELGGTTAPRRSLPRSTQLMALESVLAAVSLVGMAVLAGNGPRVAVRGRGGMRVGLGVVAALSISAAAATLAIRQATVTHRTPKEPAISESLVRTFSANEFEQADLVWKILKSFSLLSVKEGRGSIHRLLAQALRATQSEEDCQRNLECCVRAVKQLWCFKPEKVETWQDSLNMLEHVKSVVIYSFEHRTALAVEVATLSKEAGVFSAMALNRFVEAQSSLELSLEILGDVNRANKAALYVRAAALLELGRVFRYQGSFAKAEESLRRALEIYNSLARKDAIAKRGVADTLHELGVLEVKKHCLDSAASFLQQALDLRRAIEVDSAHGDGVEADCAATLHQLAAVHVARKPPALDRAEALLQQALGLSMQIGQRAATLKQLARVAIREGSLDQAELYLAQALELYVELYGGESALHINVATVKFQLGALAVQREQFDQAWIHFSECLRIRRHVYAYASTFQDGYGSTEKDANPAHIDVSAVLHELGCVAFAQQRVAQACRMLNEEKSILERLYETSSQHQRILQARLTNLTWLRKCAKQMGDEELASKISAERSDLKKRASGRSGQPSSTVHPDTRRLQHEALNCRLVARQFALAGKKNGSPDRMELLACLARLDREIQRSPPSEMRLAALDFQRATSEAAVLSNAYSKILEASDNLRDVLRAQGLQINDSFSSKGGRG